MTDDSIASGAAALAGLLERFSEAHGDGMHATAITGLFVIRSSRPTDPLHGLQQPAVCIVAQGRKQVMAGRSVLTYDPAHYLVAAVEVPVVGQIVEASGAKPYLCLRFDLDPAAIAALIMEAPNNGGDGSAPGTSLAISRVTSALLDAAIRLVRLLDAPDDIAVLAPLAEREILYRLLTGEQAARLRQIAIAESRTQQVTRAIGWIKENFRAPFSVEALAAHAHMSPSTLHANFKAVTAMSPLQYQKQLRLQEARRLILSQSLDAAVAGHRVGYDSPSQFSREYKRLFGAPPARDIARLRLSPFALQTV